MAFIDSPAGRNPREEEEEEEEEIDELARLFFQDLGENAQKVVPSGVSGIT